MTILQNFIIPLIKTMFYLIIFGFLAFITFRAIFNSWTRYWKFFIKYKLRKVPYKNEDMDWIMEANKTMDKGMIKAELLIARKSLNRVNELMFIFDDINKQSEGGLNSSRLNDSNNLENNLPNLPKEEIKNGKEKK